MLFQYRHRETSYDARSKKLLEVSKTGEITIETLQRQRDALELRFFSVCILWNRYKVTDLITNDDEKISG